MQKTERLFGIDLLRIVSMIMIVILHIMGHGGILKNLPISSPGHYWAWILEIASYGAVNCYALISGYVGISSKFKYSSIINLLFSVVFYSLGITLIFGFFMPESMNFKNIFSAVFPFASNYYWYFTAYFCMFFFIPFFNYLINTSEYIFSTKLIISVVTVLSVFPTLFQFDLAVTKNGYSALWLSALYLIGAYIKKYGIGNNLKKTELILIYLTCIAVNCISKFAIEHIAINIVKEARNSNILISYCSPTVLISSVALLILFSKFRFGNKTNKIISFFAPLSFGVYLIHDSPLIRMHYISNKFAGLTDLNPVIMILAVILSATVIWFVCSLTDKIRLQLFKLLKTDVLSKKIAAAISKTFISYFNKQ